MQVSFALRKDKINKEGLFPVRMIITLNGERIRRNVKSVRTKQKDWKNQRVKANLKNEDYNFHIEFNKELDELENRIKLIHRYALLNNIPLTKEYVIDKLENDGINSNSITPSLFESFQEFIDTNKSTKAKGTIKKYVSCKNFIKDFDQTKNYNLRFDNINVNFYEYFRDYTFNKRNTLNNYWIYLFKNY